MGKVQYCINVRTTHSFFRPSLGHQDSWGNWVFWQGCTFTPGVRGEEGGVPTTTHPFQHPSLSWVIRTRDTLPWTPWSQQLNLEAGGEGRRDKKKTSGWLQIICRGSSASFQQQSHTATRGEWKRLNEWEGKLLPLGWKVEQLQNRKSLPPI